MKAPIGTAHCFRCTWHAKLIGDAVEVGQLLRELLSDHTAAMHPDFDEELGVIGFHYPPGTHEKTA